MSAPVSYDDEHDWPFNEAVEYQRLVSRADEEREEKLAHVRTDNAAGRCAHCGVRVTRGEAAVKQYGLRVRRERFNDDLPMASVYHAACWEAQ